MAIARQLVEAIRAGSYPVNSRLPAENDLAQQFGTSRVSVREALSALQFAGYVESRRGSGTVVVAVKPAGSTSGAAPGGLPVDHLELLEARLVLEPQVLALAAFDPDRRALRVARQLIDGMALSLAEPALDASTDLCVHAALVETCRNSYLVGECRRLIDAAASPYYQRTRMQAWADSELLDRWVSEHRRVLDAIAGGDPAAAQAASREHLLRVVDKLAADDSLSSRDRERLGDTFARFAVGPGRLPPGRARVHPIHREQRDPT